MSLKLGTTDISGVPTTLINTVNNKLDASTYTSNPRTNAVYITETYHNGSSWYRVWSDGFIEQGGNYYLSSGASEFNQFVSLIKNYTNTNYCIVTTSCSGIEYTSSTSNAQRNQVMLWSGMINRKSSTGFYLNRQVSADGNNVNWYACGY